MDGLPWDRTVRHRDDGTGHADVRGPAPERVRHVRARDGWRLVRAREFGLVHRHPHPHVFEEVLDDDLRRIRGPIAEVRWDHDRLRIPDGEALDPDVETLDHRKGHGPDREAEGLPRPTPAEGKCFGDEG